MVSFFRWNPSRVHQQVVLNISERSMALVQIDPVNFSALLSVSTKSPRPSHASTMHPSMTEGQIVQALSEHAHSIAAAVLSRPETGMDVVLDAQVRFWLFCLHASPPPPPTPNPSCLRFSEDPFAYDGLPHPQTWGCKANGCSFWPVRA